MSPNMKRRPGAEPEASSESILLAAARVPDDDHAVAVDALARDPWWSDHADSVLTRLAESGREFTAQDLRDGGVPEPDHPNRWGALFLRAHVCGLIVPVRFATASRRARHGGVLRVWRGAPHQVGAIR